MPVTPSFAIASLTVALGGALGAWLRFLVARLIPASPFPYATLLVNLIGSLLMGLLAGWLLRQPHGAEGWRLLLGVGVLGGFTTFSAFSLEVAQMIQRGTYSAAALYIAASLLLGIGCLFLGLAVARAM
ncbi:MAG: fluoride efflux transporter CrcB [Pseudomonadota bacterium]|jgi:CrcB protein